MPRYDVIVTQYRSYEVEAENEDEAYFLGLNEFVSDMCSPIADTHYDEVEVREIEDAEVINEMRTLEDDGE